MGHPAVFRDDLGERFGRQRSRFVLTHEPPQERSVERRDGDGVLHPGADVADAKLQRRVGVGGADVPPDFAAGFDEIHSLVFGDDFLVLRARAQRGWQIGARQIADEVQAIGLVARVAPAVKGRGGGQRVNRGQVAADGRHDSNARFRVAEARVNVHSADDQTAHGLLKRHQEARVALLGRDRQIAPLREGMGGGAEHRGPVRLRRLDDDSPGLAQRLARLGHRSAYPCVGLDLGAKRLPRDLVRPDAGFAGFRRWPGRDRR